MKTGHTPTIMKPRFSVGQQFIPLGQKNKTVYTVADIHTTTNLKGEIVKIRYVATHDFLGYKLTDYDVIETTIARGEISGRKIK